MTSVRLQREVAEVNGYLPPDTQYRNVQGRDVWVVRKQTEFGILFEFAIYFDPDEQIPGYCAQVLSPVLERAWKTPHVGHLMPDGVICLGPSSPRTGPTLRWTWARVCLWAEGMAAMIAAHRRGTPIHFPFSSNNSERDVA